MPGLTAIMVLRWMLKTPGFDKASIKHKIHYRTLADLSGHSEQLPSK